MKKAMIITSLLVFFIASTSSFAEGLTKFDKATQQATENCKKSNGGGPKAPILNQANAREKCMWERFNNRDRKFTDKHNPGWNKPKKSNETSSGLSSHDA